MKIVFLDVDGVLNKNNTKERIPYMNTSFTGLDPQCLKVFKDWLKEKEETKIILSSTWRHIEVFKEALNAAGIHWIAETPRDQNRGLEIDSVLSKGYIDKYAILDDLGHSEFLRYQRRYLVQTSPVRGIEPKKIKKLNEILYG